MLAITDRGRSALYLTLARREAREALITRRPHLETREDRARVEIWELCAGGYIRETDSRLCALARRSVRLARDYRLAAGKVLP